MPDPASVIAAPPPLPAWYPPWAKELAEMYFSGTICMFVLHGNVHDLVGCQGADGKRTFVSLPDFHATQVFGAWDVVLDCDLGRGLRCLAGSDSKLLQG